jgi:chromosome partitioning protein
MITITLLMEKGGVGKTTLATTIAAGLAIQGKRVLIIDADGQGHATRILGAKLSPGLYDTLVREADWQDTLKIVKPEQYNPDKTGMLALLPGNHETMFIPQAINDPFLLQQRINELAEVFDVVIIDTSPTPSLLNASILMATDYVLVPSKMEFLSLQSLKSSMKTVEGFSNKRIGGGLLPVTPLGIIPMTYRANTTEHTENLKLVGDTYGVLVWPVIADRIIWAEAAVRQQSIFVYAPQSRASEEAWQVVNRVSEVWNA